MRRDAASILQSNCWNMLAWPVLLLVGCGTEDNRWSAVTGLSGDAVQPDFMVSSTAIPQAGDVTLGNLSDSVAAAYIAAAAKVATSPSQLTSILQTPIRSGGIGANVTGFQRALVMNVFEKGYAPADSLVQTRLTISPKNFSFANLEAAQTRYSTIDIAKISTTDSISGSAELDASSPIPGGNGSASITGSHSVEKTEDVSARVEDLTVNLENGSLVVFRQGARGRDLTGNTIVKLTIQDASPVGEGQDRIRMMVTGIDVGGIGQWKTPTTASVDLKLRHGLHPTGMIAEARLNYVLRHVTGGAYSYDEGDDTVRFERGCVAKNVVLVPPSDTALQTWVIRDGSNTLLIDTDSGQEDMTFEDWSTATKFVSWLQATGAISINGLRLRVYPIGDTLDGTVPLGSNRSSLRVVSTTGVVQTGLLDDSRAHACPKL